MRYELTEDLLGDVSEQRNGKQSKYLESLLESLEESGNEGLEKIAFKYHCEINCSTEKHHELQFTYYYEITSNLVNAVMYLSIESGINNGTLLLEYSFDKSLEPDFRWVYVLKDITLDENEYKDKSALVIQKAEIMLSKHKGEIMRLIREQSYDNYVTGGGTIKTDKYYEERVNALNAKGLYWDAVYVPQKADINWKR